jgi:hypothetical protein
MFDTFASLSGRFARVRVPDELAAEWQSPYRLLFGAAYSVGVAERSFAGRTGDAPEVPLNLSSALEGAVQDGERTAPWFPFWRASYMLTNAIYRVAAAAEKTCYLSSPGLQGKRWRIWEEAAIPTSPFSKKLSSAHDLLGKMPDGKDRAAYLRAQRDMFPSSMTVALPLVCAFIQTDIDKHVAYKPLKPLLFEGTLAAAAFLEACDLWDAAIDAERRAGSPEVR